MAIYFLCISFVHSRKYLTIFKTFRTPTPPAMKVCAFTSMYQLDLFSALLVLNMQIISYVCENQGLMYLDLSAACCIVCTQNAVYFLRSFYGVNSFSLPIYKGSWVFTAPVVWGHNTSWLFTFEGPTQPETSPNYMICVVFHVVSSEWCGQRQTSSPMTNNGVYYPSPSRFVLTILSSYKHSRDVHSSFSAWTRETTAIVFVKGQQGMQRLQGEISLWFFFNRSVFMTLA